MNKKRGDVIIKWHEKINAVSIIVLAGAIQREVESSSVSIKRIHTTTCQCHTHTHTQKHFKCRVKTRRMSQADEVESDI